MVALALCMAQSAQAFTTVKIGVADAVATEIANGATDPAVFEISRSGELAGELLVFFSIHGTAKNGGDYKEIASTIRIPAGAQSARLEIVPLADMLTVVEKMETVGIQLEPSPLMGPADGYDIDAGAAEAMVVIFEQTPPPSGAVEIGVPGTGLTYREGEEIVIAAGAYHPDFLPYVNFYDGEVKIGSSSPARAGDLSFHKFWWRDASPGTHIVTARANTPSGAQLVSSRIEMKVLPADGTPLVGIRFVPEQLGTYLVEGEYAPGSLEVSRTGSTAEALQVFYQVGGTATPGEDYDKLPGWVVIPAGQTVTLIWLNVKDDLYDEVDETVLVTLMPVPPNVDPVAGGIYIIDENRRTAGLTIFDDDDRPGPLPVVRIAAVTPHTSEPIPNALVAPGLFRITRSGPTTEPLVVAVEYEGTATAGVDYPRLPGSVTIAAGSSEADLRVEPLDDQVVEGDETVIARLPGSVAYNVDEEFKRATVIIHDDEPGEQASIRITAPQQWEYFRAGTSIRVDAVAVDPDGYMPRVDFYADERLIGSSEINFIVAPPDGTPIHHTILWVDVPPGQYLLTARGVDSNGHLVVSAPVRIQVENRELNVVSITGSPEEIAEPIPVSLVNPGKFTITRSGSTALPLRVDLKYSGSATMGVDYDTLPNSVVIPENQTSVDIWVRPKADSVVEPVETVEARIGAPMLSLSPDPADRPYEIHSEHRAATIKIHDGGSGLPVVSIWKIFGETIEPSPNMDVAPAVFAVRRSGSTAESLLINLKYGGTAVAGEDYLSKGRVLEIPAGKSEVRVEYYALDDALVEGDETVIVTLEAATAPPTYVIDNAHSTVTLVIHDNDHAALPEVRISAVDAEATEFSPFVDAIDPAVFRITRTGETNESVVVFYSIHGTAVNGEDYRSIPESVTIPAGRQSVDIEIVPLAEQAEVFNEYEIVAANGITWEEARSLAGERTRNGVEGHLATVRSQAEADKIEELRQQSALGALWLGGHQPSERISPTEGWFWVNDEGPIPGYNGGTVYANWQGGEPNDYWGAGSENYLSTGWLNSPQWNDEGMQGHVQGYVVEYEVPVGVAVERMETVGLRLEESQLVGPVRTYEIDRQSRQAGAVIFDLQRPAEAETEVVIPKSGYSYEEDVEFLVAGYDPKEAIYKVDYFVDGQYVGSSEIVFIQPPTGGVVFHSLKWPAPSKGEHRLIAKGTSSTGQVISSSEVPFVVGGIVNQPPVVRITQPAAGTVFLLGDAIEIVVEGSDPDGRINRLDLSAGETSLASTGSSTLRFTWTPPAAGAYTLVGKAVDDKGAESRTEVRILVRTPDEVAFVQRDLPEGYTPGAALTVLLKANPPGGSSAYAVEDRPPAGWRVTEVSHEGVYDAATGKVKFGPYFDAVARVLSYRVTPTFDATGRQEFTGTSSVNGAIYPVRGDRYIEQVNPYHPADRDENYSIQLQELTAYGAAWKRGETWPVGPVPIPLSYVTRAGLLWKRGEAYRFDGSLGAPPACWVPVGQVIRPFSIGSAEREVLGELSAGVAAQVQIAVSPATGTSSYGVEERVPSGWAVSNISGEGVYDASRGCIRWGVFLDSQARTLTYSITPPAGVTSVGRFSGLVSLDGEVVEVESQAASLGSTPLRISAISRAVGGGVEVQISGAEGQTGVLEASTDLVTWSELKAIFLPGGDVTVADEPAEGELYRFYRVRVQ